MKKKLCIIIISLICSMACVNIFVPDYITLYDVNMTNDENEKNVEVDIVIYKFWNTTSITEKMAMEHLQINGKFKTMVVRIYISRASFKNEDKPYKIIEIK